MKNFVIIAVLLMLNSFQAQANESPKALQEAFMAALRSNDAAALAACYDEHAINFPVDSLMGLGPDSVRKKDEDTHNRSSVARPFGRPWKPACPKFAVTVLYHSEKYSKSPRWGMYSC